MNTGWHHKNTRKGAHAGVIITFTIFCIYCSISLEQGEHHWLHQRMDAKEKNKAKQEEARNTAQHASRIVLTNPPRGLTISQAAQMS